MSHPTDVETFQASLQSIPEIVALVDSVADDAELHELTDGTRFDPLSASLSLVVVAALWKLVSIGIDGVRHLSDTATAKRRIQLIQELQEMGYEREAPFIVERLFQEIRKRPEDDPVLKKLIGLFSSG